MAEDSKTQESKLESRLKLIGAFVAVGGVILTVVQFTWSQSVEAAKPYLEKKLQWCEEAVETTAFIATADSATAEAKKQRFWQMYWGVMGMVENKNVVDAMVAFGSALRNQKPASELATASLDLAHACRQELADSWSPIWKPFWR